MRPNVSIGAKLVTGIAPTISTGTQTGAAIDRLNYDSANIHASDPALTGANTCVVTLEQSADGATNWTAVPGFTLTLTATAKGGSASVNLLPLKRYIRVKAVIPVETGPTFSATVALGGARYLPA